MGDELTAILIISCIHAVFRPLIKRHFFNIHKYVVVL